jgi:hypothetical protein
VSSWSSSASASKYSFTNSGCMMPPYVGRWPPALPEAMSPAGNTCSLLRQRAVRFTHRPGEGLCEGGDMDREDLRLAADPGVPGFAGKPARVGAGGLAPVAAITD